MESQEKSLNNQALLTLGISVFTVGVVLLTVVHPLPGAGMMIMGGTIIVISLVRQRRTDRDG